MKTALALLLLLAALPAAAAPCLRGPRDPSDRDVLKRLNAKGREFYQASKKTREGYDCKHPYKHFLLEDFALSEMDEEGYFHHRPGWKKSEKDPRPEKVVDEEQGFYRLVKDCVTGVTIQRQFILMDEDYRNMQFRNRRAEQCAADGTTDVFYLESLQKPE